jgi:hypothetical protein
MTNNSANHDKDDDTMEDIEQEVAEAAARQQLAELGEALAQQEQRNAEVAESWRTKVESDQEFAQYIEAIKTDATYQAVAETVKNDYPSNLKEVELEMIALKRFTEQTAASGDDDIIN